MSIERQLQGVIAPELSRQVQEEQEQPQQAQQEQRCPFYSSVQQSPRTHTPAPHTQQQPPSTDVAAPHAREQPQNEYAPTPTPHAQQQQQQQQQQEQQERPSHGMDFARFQAQAEHVPSDLACQLGAVWGSQVCVLEAAHFTSLIQIGAIRGLR